jgi:mannose-6-phosphate isomerase
LIRKITNQALPYAWGSKTLISDYLGYAATGGPMAEIWFGTHPASMAYAADAGTSLLQLREGKPLSFLMKFLAADQALSIQAHPNLAQAAAGFASGNQNYKDANHKPEAIVAVSEFEALCGFKSDKQLRELLEDILSYPITSELRQAATHWQQLLEQGLERLFSHLLNSRNNFVELGLSLAALADFDGRFEIAARLNSQHPGDPGVAVALLMNYVRLQPGQSLALAAGNVHAYLSGLGVEVMAASDNVLRGGLTEKHIDVAELQRVVDFESRGTQLVEQKTIAAGLTQFEIAFDEFVLYRIEPSGDRLHADLKISADAIALCIGGEVAISNSQDEREVLTRGEAAFIGNSARLLSFSGAGTIYLAVGRD